VPIVETKLGIVILFIPQLKKHWFPSDVTFGGMLIDANCWQPPKQ
jgi:hypothetical protein